MDIDLFRRFINTAPNTLHRLLIKSGIEPTSNIKERLRLLYEKLTIKDVHYYWEKGIFSPTRLAELCSQVGLEKSFVNLPIVLFELYEEEEAKRRRDLDFTEEEVFFYLGGSHQANYTSIVDGAFIAWAPNARRIWFVLESDEVIAKIIEQFLSSKGRNFNSIDQLVDYAKTHVWPGWETIKHEYENGDDSVREGELELDEGP